MESLAYIISPQMILVAVDANYDLKYSMAGIVKDFEFEDVEKVSVINETNLFAGVGLPHRVTPLLEFFKNLKPDNQTFDSVADDMTSLYDMKTFEQLIAEMGKTNSELRLLEDETGYISDERLYHYLDTHEDSKARLRDLSDFRLLNLKTDQTELFLFGWENNAPRCSTYLNFGNSLVLDREYEKTDQVIIYCKSCLLDNDENIAIQEEASAMLDEVLEQEKDVPPENLMKESLDTWRVYEKYGKILEHLIKKMSRYNREPYVVFYELCAVTEFTFWPSYSGLEELVITRNIN